MLPGSCYPTRFLLLIREKTSSIFRLALDDMMTTVPRRRVCTPLTSTSIFAAFLLFMNNGVMSHLRPFTVQNTSKEFCWKSMVLPVEGIEQTAARRNSKLLRIKRERNRLKVASTMSTQLIASGPAWLTSERGISSTNGRRCDSNGLTAGLVVQCSSK
jgi:hypothetical protein